MKSKPRSKRSVSERMRAVKRCGTTCERLFEEMIVEASVGYVKQAKLQDCTPDFVFPKERIAVFIDGDFWHGRIAIEWGVKGLRRSFRGHTREFWIKKIVRNVTRDKRQTMSLRRSGWSVMRIWEKDLLRNPAAVRANIQRRVRRRRITLLAPP
jgi:DNA mismatch endonuclease Vsr